MGAGPRSSGAGSGGPAWVLRCGMIETVLGPLWVWLALGENPGVASLLGGALILGALLTHALLDLLDPRPRLPGSPA